MKIPKFLKDTEIQKFIRTEIEYAQKLLNELKVLNSNFISIDAKENIKSRYIAIWTSQVLSIFYAKTQTLQSITSNINSVIFALRHIGTDESFRLIFKAFLNVDISVTTPEAGVINISLKGTIKTNFTTFISPSTKGKRSKKILIREKKKGYAASKKALVFNSLPKGYDHSIYAFIKGIIPIGRVLKINNKDGANIITFNN
ncbi:MULTISPECIES: DUF735 family protein [Borreliella]|uniref:Uncharacterized protein n=6 Tax=Borreliella TaxID=64895 RepID=A0A7I6GXD3_BORGP|nr:DUF735 family protein [Borreliella bavariensis]AAU85926.1 hypothetical protein BGP076 [Borreliella bavariensis PBi]AZA27396.1 hypothetical protein DB299_05980 [Borreliella bavariensis PBi]WLN24820.1 DUF735 family protein [Borreliella bavariensis]